MYYLILFINKKKKKKKKNYLYIYIYTSKYYISHNAYFCYCNT